jgi:hypothetical protein
VLPTMRQPSATNPSHLLMQPPSSNLAKMSEPSKLPLNMTPFTLVRKEQFLTLHYLLGLRLSPPSENMPSFNDLPGSSAKDVLFVCIDTKFTPDGRKLGSQEFQFGFCSLDMRDVLNLAKKGPMSQRGLESGRHLENLQLLCRFL